MVPPIRSCVCGRAFRPEHLAQRRCSLCIRAFALGMMDGHAGGAPLAPGIILSSPTPRGVCAHLGCARHFTPEGNQRYCSTGCRVQAQEERRVARMGQRATVH